MKTMKSLLLAAAAVAASSTMVSADTINFDNVTSGSTANSAAPQGVSFYNAVFTPDLDGFGDPIIGSDKWQIDGTAPSVIVQNPLNRGYGLAPSGANALDAVDQPVLMLFSQPLNLGSFSLTLDNSTFGNPGNSLILFTSRSGNTDTTVGMLNTDQTVPGFVASFNGSLENVTQIVLPSGAFYDNITFTTTPAPEPGTLALLGVGAGLLALRIRRQQGK